MVVFLTSFLFSVAIAKDVSPPKTPLITLPSQSGNIAGSFGIRIVKAPSRTRLVLDNLEPWPESATGLQTSWMLRRTLPQFESVAFAEWADQLARTFSAKMEAPYPRFRFMFVDTLNPTLWSLGGGYFAVHSALLRVFPSEKELEFIFLLELAHSYLGHRFIDLSNAKLPIQEYLYWGLEVLPDPYVVSDFSYTLEEEVAALKLVQKFYTSDPGSLFSVIEAVNHTLALWDKKESKKFSLSKIHPYLSQAEAQLNEKRRPELTFVRSAFVDDLEKSLFQQFPWLYEKESDLRAKKFFEVILLLDQFKYQEALTLTSALIKSHPRNEVFSHLHGLSLLLNNRFKNCISFLKSPWSHFDSRRQLLEFQCVLAEGHLSLAEVRIKNYRNQYPYDYEGAFWEAFVAIKLRKPVDDKLKLIEKEWGNRPFFWALRGLEFSLSNQPLAAKEWLEKMPTIAERRFPEAELGMYAFAQSWFKKSYSALGEREEKSVELELVAKRKWPFAHILKDRFPLMKFE